jgi:hypothetical protein
MKNLITRKFKFDLLPPHLVAFLTGVILALCVGIVFRKVIDKMSDSKIQASESQVVSKKEAPLAEAQPIRTAARDGGTQDPEKKMTAKQESDTLLPAEQNSSETIDGQKEVDLQNAQPTASEQTASLPAAQQNPNAEGEYDSWREILRQIEQKFVVRDPNAQVMMTPRYRHNAKGLAITRGQFLDIVTDKAPANLPTRPQSRTVIFHALAGDDFEPKEFLELVRDSNADFVSLCSPAAQKVNFENAQRVTVLLENTNSKINCLSNLISSNSALSQVTEFGVISFTRGVTYFASVSSKQKLFSLQMWNPDWLLETTVSLEESRSRKPALGRTQRLANVARALSQPSDVRVQVPASFRPIHGPALDPVDPTPPRPLILGNFALIPSHMPRGSLIATAYIAPNMTSGRSVTAKLQGIDKTKALVLATQGKSLQFMKVHKDK